MSRLLVGWMSGVWVDVRCLVGCQVFGWISGVGVDFRCLGGCQVFGPGATGVETRSSCKEHQFLPHSKHTDAPL